MPFMDLFHLWWRCDPRWRGGEASSTFLHMGCLHTFALFAFLGFLTSKLLSFPLFSSNTFELLLISSWDLALLPLCIGCTGTWRICLTDREHFSVRHCSPSGTEEFLPFFGLISSSPDAPILLKHVGLDFLQMALACIWT